MPKRRRRKRKAFWSRIGHKFQIMLACFGAAAIVVLVLSVLWENRPYAHEPAPISYKYW